MHEQYQFHRIRGNIREKMNCNRCHHTDEVHIPDKKSNLMIKLGKCKIPTCTCVQFANPIEEIDEDLL